MEIADPPLIYLDTQDFVRFRQEIDADGVRHQYSELKRMRESGLIRLGYSAIHVWEFITPYEDTARFGKDRAERGRLMVDLCGRNAFPFYSDFAHGGKFPNGGSWFPKKIEPMDLEKIKSDELKKLLESKGLQLNREMRRKLESRAFLRSLLSDDSTYSGDIDQVSGLNPAMELALGKYYKKFLIGDISAIKLNKKIVGWASDPEEYGRFWYEFGKKGNALEEFVGSHLIKIKGVISEMIEVHSDVSEQFDAAKAQVKDLDRRLKEFGVRGQARKILLPSIPKRPDTPQFPEDARLSDVFRPGRLSHIWHYVNKRILGVGRFQPSDAGDLMHLVYAPDCNYVRCDDKMCNLFADYLPFEGKLMRSLDELLGKVM